MSSNQYSYIMLLNADTANPHRIELIPSGENTIEAQGESLAMTELPTGGWGVCLSPPHTLQNPVQGSWSIDNSETSPFYVVRVTDTTDQDKPIVIGNIGIDIRVFTNQVFTSNNTAIACDYVDGTLYVTLANLAASERQFKFALLDSDAFQNRDMPIENVWVSGGWSFTATMEAVSLQTGSEYTGDEIPVELKYSYPNVVSAGLSIEHSHFYIAGQQTQGNFTFSGSENAMARFMPSNSQLDLSKVDSAVVITLDPSATLNLTLIADPTSTAFWWGDINTTIKPITFTSSVAVTANDVWDIAFRDINTDAFEYIQLGTDSIAAGAYAGRSDYTELRINHTIKNIGSGAFYGGSACHSLIFMTRMNESNVVEGTEYIASAAFGGWSSAYSLALPDSLTTLDTYAFTGWSSCSYLYVGTELTSIVQGTFSGLSSINMLEFSGLSKLNAVGDYAFQNFNNLTELNLPHGVTTIGEYAFDGCTALTSVTLPETVQDIADYAFNMLSNVTSLTLHAVNIGAHAFDGWSSFTDTLVMPQELVSIGEFAFNEWSNASGVTLNEGLVDIAPNAFYGWYIATDPLVIPTTVTSLTNSFVAWNAGTAITLHEGITTLGGSGTTVEFANWGTNNTGSIDIVIPDTVTRLNVFANSTPIRTLVIGNSEALNMSDCYINTTDKLESVKFTSVTPPIANVSLTGNDNRAWILHIPDSAYDAYVNHDIWGSLVTHMETNGRLVRD